MRSAIRPALLALALAVSPTATAHAALGDGAENAGSGCHWVPLSSGGTNTGVIVGGPWVAADLIENRSGVIGVEDSPGLATSVTITCRLRGGSLSRPVQFSTSGTFPGTGVAVLEPRLVSYQASSAPATVCTEVSWFSNDGFHTRPEECLPL